MIHVEIDDGNPDDPVSEVLGRLAEADEDFDYASLRRHWRRRGCISPKQMALLAWRMGMLDIGHNPSDFQVSTATPEHREAILTMEEWKRDQILPYLTEKQKDELGI